MMIDAANTKRVLLANAYDARFKKMETPSKDGGTEQKI